MELDGDLEQSLPYFPFQNNSMQYIFKKLKADLKLKLSFV